MVLCKKCRMRHAAARTAPSWKRVGECEPNRRKRVRRYQLVNLVGPCSHKKYICQPPSKRVICTALQAVGFYIYRNKCLLGMARRKLHTKKRCARTDFDDVNGAFLPLVKFKTVFGIVKLCKLVFFAFARDDEVFWVEQLRHYTYYTAQRVSAKHSRFHRRQSPRISV